MPSPRLLSVAVSCALARLMPLDAQQQDDERQRGRGLDQVDDVGVSEQRQRPAAQRRAGDRGQLKSAQVPGDGVGKNRPRHQLRQERALGRLQERAGHADKEQADEHRRQVQLEERDRGQPQRSQAAERQRADDHPLAIDAIGDVTGQQRQRQHGNHLHQAHQADVERIAGALIDFPDHGDRLHLQAQDRHHVADPVAAEIGPPHGRVGIVQRLRSRRGIVGVAWDMGLAGGPWQCGPSRCGQLSGSAGSLASSSFRTVSERRTVPDGFWRATANNGPAPRCTWRPGQHLRHPAVPCANLARLRPGRDRQFQRHL